MSDIAIRVDGLGKQYLIGKRQASYGSLRESLAETFARPFRAARSLVTRNGNGHLTSDLRPLTSDSGSSPSDTIWALKDVSFEVTRGEVVGIIGRNGAGKSTLLKVLSRITEPTTGAVDIYGRVGSLLEVGTGFHPELTGRENIFLNGAILGMRRAEIERKFDEIVAFAELEKFLDTPVKHYSSGMYTRLAFSVAAHLEPEILLVDEVLAVGDAEFQKKCLGRMKDVAQQGRTVLFVSHNMTALQSLCERAIWLDAGRVIQDGEARRVVSAYLETSAAAVLDQTWEDPATAPGNDYARLRRARLLVDGENPSEPITVRTPLRVEFEYWNFIPDAELNLSLHLYGLDGGCIFNSGSGSAICPSGLMRSVCFIPGNLLNDGTYRIMIMIVRDQSVALWSCEDVIVFEVIETDRGGAWYGKWPGTVRPKLRWDTEVIEGNGHAPRFAQNRGLGKSALADG
jgi:lipopolysaccharide transport system ATP-binding protein